MPRLTRPSRPPRRRPARLAALLQRRGGAVALALGVALAVALPAAGLWWNRDRIADGIEDWMAGRAEDALRMTARAGLGVREIVVTGRVHTSAAEILSALDLHDGDPLLGFDSRVARAELERLPWVKEAQVERRFPHRVTVRIVERTPLALWQTQGRHAVLDGDGREIRKVDPGAFADLIVVIGADAPAHARDLLEMLATEPDLRSRVVAAVRVAGRRWDLVLDGDLRVHLPEQQAAAAWARLADAQRREAILARAVAGIDLRLADRITVRPVAADAAVPVVGPRPRPAIRSN
jgi:cell division protein FtsQ